LPPNIAISSLWPVIHGSSNCEPRSGRVPPLRSGPGCARGRQQYDRCQPRRASGGAPRHHLDRRSVRRAAAVPALRARIPHATSRRHGSPTGG